MLVLVAAGRGVAVGVRVGVAVGAGPVVGAFGVTVGDGVRVGTGGRVVITPGVDEGDDVGVGVPAGQVMVTESVSTFQCSKCGSSPFSPGRTWWSSHTMSRIPKTPGSVQLKVMRSPVSTGSSTGESTPS